MIDGATAVHRIFFVIYLILLLCCCSSPSLINPQYQQQKQKHQFFICVVSTKVWLHETIRTYIDCSCTETDSAAVEGALWNQAKLSFPATDISKFFPLKKPTEPLHYSTLEDRVKDREDRNPR
jgi:hypothetical protein